MSVDSEPFQEYLKEIRAKYLTGDYTEITLRTPLENFIRRLSEDCGLIQEPKRIAKIGAPDFKAYHKSVKVGYIETKDLGRNLDEELQSEQIKKYRSSIDNVVLTNYGRFILLRGKQIPFDFNLFNNSDLDNASFSISDVKMKEFLRLLETFFTYNLPTIKSSEELAVELSKKAKLLKYLAKEQLEEDLLRARDSETASSVYDFYAGTKELIKDIKIDDCADAYAQTITYGLFLAKMTCSGDFDRRTAASYIPHSVGIIKRIFMNISGDSLPSNLAWIVDETIDVLNATDIKSIISEIDERGKTDRDPFTFFYEGFLSTYDPEKRKHLGVYYTPRPVVSFIVNSINLILEKDFERLNGFADDDVTVLDPAVGTGTFLWLIYTLTLVKLKNKGLSGLIKEKIQHHVLRDFYGLEILITPYIIAHLKLSLALKKWFYELKDNDRIQVYLANTLEPSESHGLIPFLREISEESKTANELKLKKKILVITSNPPYRGMSVNKGPWIEDLLKKGYTHEDGTKDNGYYQIDGRSLEERNPKWLQDDYVKFIRFAQWKIDKAGEGIVGFVTNHSYLDNPTFRGMRQSLINSFNRIYILNLHGSSLRHEKAPEDREDKNVFDIRPGVTISILEKNKGSKSREVFYGDLYGKRIEKYAWLDRHTVSNTEWLELKPKSPYYFLVPKDEGLLEKYNSFPRLDQIFSHYSLAIQTHRDSFAIDLDKEVLTKRISLFRDSKVSDEIVRQTFSLEDTSNWKMKNARRIVGENGDWQTYITRILYRPFDTRWLFYHEAIVDRIRKGIMKQMNQPNVALLVSKQLSMPTFNHVFVTDTISDAHVVSNRTKEGNYHFPLYLYADNETQRPNLNEEITKTLNEMYGVTPSPEEIFYYIYAILHSSKYRERYVEFLQSDFPRIPFTKDYGNFKRLAALGKELVDLHLVKTKLGSSIRFDVQGSNIAEFAKFRDGKVYVNSTQFFEGIPKKTWDFYVGAYQILAKWLKSRKGRELSGSEVEQFIQIVEIINRTLEHMKEIDAVEFLE
jgi:hypothetical protein